MAAEKFWTTDKLERMRDEFLPRHPTVRGALLEARKFYRRKLDRSTFSTCFHDHFGYTPISCCIVAKYPPLSDSQPINIATKAKKTYVFGVVADTHCGSRRFMAAEFRDFISQAYEAGVRDVYHCGDLIDGGKVYPGQEYDLEDHGIDAQMCRVANTFPEHPGLRYLFITGNHDESFRKFTGAVPGRDLVNYTQALGRNDFRYLGPMRATVNYGGLLIRLLHPDGGGAHLSQAKINSAIAELRSQHPQPILLWGHFHRMTTVIDPSTCIVQGGTFQSQTSYMARKGLIPMVGGWIITIDTDSKNRVQNISTKAITYGRSSVN